MSVLSFTVNINPEDLYYNCFAVKLLWKFAEIMKTEWNLKINNLLFLGGKFHANCFKL